ncbi:type II CAAX prenyl endopeptidase Rce1 family protein [Ideonella sp.]|uniref:CPBP family glutamic-type intramembrane protease n=1 Tax=Ideonella sp. TaxID=1929293 RepID=UPI003BB5A113
MAPLPQTSSEPPRLWLTLRSSRALAQPGLVGWLAVAALAAASLPAEAFWRSIVLAPWLEEAVLRWGVQDPLAARLCPSRPDRAWLPPLLAAVLFSALHLLLSPGGADLWRAAATVLPAWWLGHVYRHRPSIARCAAWHALFNLVWLIGWPAMAGHH